MAREALDFVAPYVTPGISTFDLDRLVAGFIRAAGGICAPLGYNGYPKSCCVSRNDVICHGIPGKGEFLEDGDIVNIDVTTIVGGYFGDTSRTFLVGNVAPEAVKLVDVTKRALEKAISICAPGVPFARIGEVIEEVVEPHGFGIVRDFCGHGIGTVFHDAPNVLHYRSDESRGVMRLGQVFTIEPMINSGSWHMVMDKNGWTARTVDGGLSAQFEHTIGIVEGGTEVFTK